MAYQSEIELRVKVVTKEIDSLENRIKRIKSPKILESAQKMRAGLYVEKNRLELAQKLNVERVKDLNLRTSWLKVLKEGAAVQKQLAENTKKEADAAAKAASASAKSIRSRAGQAFGGALISGAFPILTGGSNLESTLGAAGGALGAIFGPGGAFAGGIAASALGRIVQDAEDLNTSLAALNGRLGTVGTTAAVTASDIDNLAKRLNATNEEALELANSFAAVADLSILKDLGEAFGPVGGAETFEAIAQALIDEKGALQAIDQLRGQIGLKAAEQLQDVLKIEGSQAASALLLDTVLEKAKDITDETQKQVGFWDRIAAAIFTAASGQVITPEQLVADRTKPVSIDKDAVKQALERYEKYLRDRQALDDKFSPKSQRSGRRGPRLPQSRELSLRSDIEREKLRVSELETKTLNVGRDRLLVAREEAEQITKRRDAEIKILEYARQNALNKNKVKGDEALINELYDARLSKITKTAALAAEENRVLTERIVLARELAKLAGEREIEDIGIGLRRQIGAVERRISSPFGGQDSEMLELRIQQVQRQEDAYRALDRQIVDVNKRLEDAPGNEDLIQELGLLEGKRRKYEELLPVLDQVEQKELQMQQTLQQLQPLTNALSQGLADLFTGLIDGSKDAQEVFADMLKSMGQALIQQGAVMIAQYIAIGIARMFAGLGGGNRVGPENFNLQGFGPLAPTPGAAFAEGGFVTGPTRALVGEGGQPEYIIPEDKMRESMERYSRGARGSSVIPQNGDTISAATGNTAIADKPIDVRYTVERINNVDYVTADQFQAGMRQAAQQGAMQGERRALTTLKQNTTQRRRIGL